MWYQIEMAARTITVALGETLARRLARLIGVNPDSVQSKSSGGGLIEIVRVADGARLMYLVDEET